MDGFWTNWSTNLNLSFNQTIPNSKWRYSTSATAQFRHQESYMRTGGITGGAMTSGNGAAVLSTTESVSAGENGSITYRNDWFEATVNGRFNYNHSDNNQRQGMNGNMDTYTFSYGGRANARLPWRNLNLGTDLTMQSRRGYSDASMNTNELIWNAQLSQSFLKGNALTVSLQLYDILHQQSTVSQMISALSSSETQYNAITSYGMLHVIYRLNLFGGMKAFGGGRGPGGPGFGGRRGPGGGGPRGGGFGGPRRF
jgi:hypothetical protein